MNKNIKLEDRGSFLLLRVKKHELQVREERPCELLALQSGPFTCSYSLSLSLPLSHVLPLRSPSDQWQRVGGLLSPLVLRAACVCVCARVCVYRITVRTSTRLRIAPLIK